MTLNLKFNLIFKDIFERKHQLNVFRIELDPFWKHMSDEDILIIFEKPLRMCGNVLMRGSDYIFKLSQLPCSNVHMLIWWSFRIFRIKYTIWQRSFIRKFVLQSIHRPHRLSLNFCIQIVDDVLIHWNIIILAFQMNVVQIFIYLNFI